jgi:zinc protease
MSTTRTLHLLRRFPLAALAFAAAQALAVAAPAVPGATLVREVEGIQEYRLANGLQVLLIADASKPTITVNVTYRVGSRHESYGETGMAHLLEHLMFKSTATNPNVGADLSKHGMRFNGSTDVDRTNYFETFAADPKQLAWALKTESERMTGAKVARKDLDSEMTVVRNEMETDENDPVRILVQKTTSSAFLWHAYRNDTIGARADVENVNIAHLQAFYRKFYQPDNATLIVAGSFDPKKTLALIAADFGRLPKPARVIEPTWTLEPVQDGEHEVTVRRTGGQQVVYAAYHAPAMAAVDYPAFEVIQRVLTDAPNGRLHKRLVEPGLATDSYGWVNRNAEPGVLNLAVNLKKDGDLPAAQKRFVEVVEGLATEPITAEELKRVQLQWATELEKTMADPQALCVTLSEPIAAGDYRLLFQLRDRIAALTVDQVNAVAKAWIKSSNRSLGRFIPTDTVDRAPFAEKGNAAVALKDWTPKPALAVVETFAATPANIDARSQRFTLPSGLKVVLLPKPTRGGTVEVSMNLHWGSVDALRGKATAIDTAMSLLTAGTKTKTRAQISDAFDAAKTQLGIQSNPARGITVGMNTRKETVATAIGLLAEVMREPAFPADEFDQSVRRAVAGLEQQADDPQALAVLKLERLIQTEPADDVRYTPSTEEAVARLKALKRDDVVSAWTALGGANHGEVAVVGDFDPVAVRAAIERGFGDWKSAAPYVRVPDEETGVVGQRVVTQLKDKAGAMAFGKLPLALVDTDPDYPALRVATHVLGASGFDSRLLTRLRQKDGLSYGAGSQMDASSFQKAGTLVFYAIFAPENREKVEKGFAEEIARFAKDGITADELATAKKAIQVAADTSRANDNATAARWAYRLERERTWKWDAEMDAKIAALTLDQVNAAIKRWVDPAKVDWSLAGDFDGAAAKAAKAAAAPAAPASGAAK